MSYRIVSTSLKKHEKLRRIHVHSEGRGEPFHEGVAIVFIYKTIQVCLRHNVRQLMLEPIKRDG